MHTTILPLVLAAADAAPAAELASTESLILKVVGVLAIPLATLLAALIAMLTAWVNTKRAGSKFAGGAAVVLDLLGSYLSKAKAELAPKVRDALADGVLTPAEREELKKALLELVMRDAPADAVKAVTGVLGVAFPAWLEGKAEQAIDAMASGSGSPQ
jgi:hypothetical protein